MLFNYFLKKPSVIITSLLLVLAIFTNTTLAAESVAEKSATKESVTKEERVTGTVQRGGKCSPSAQSNPNAQCGSELICIASATDKSKGVCVRAVAKQEGDWCKYGKNKRECGKNLTCTLDADGFLGLCVRE